MAIELSGAVAVITGAGSGIGRATAHALAERGSKVVVTDLDGERAEAVAAELPDAAIGLRCDVTRLTDLEAARDRALDAFGRVDLVMNNVGVIALGAFEEIPIEGWERVVDVNLMGTVRTLKAFVPLLLDQRSGHVVVTASTAGLFPYGYDRLPYTATKHAVVGMAESLALYLRPRGIGVSCFCPAGVITNIMEQVTSYGEPTQPRAPNFGVVEAEQAGELVAEGVAAGKFLILTTDEPLAELRERGASPDAYIERAIAEYG